jgi:hypothetical protein
VTQPLLAVGPYIRYSVTQPLLAVGPYIRYVLTTLSPHLHVCWDLRFVASIDHKALILTNVLADHAYLRAPFLDVHPKVVPPMSSLHPDAQVVSLNVPGLIAGRVEHDRYRARYRKQRDQQRGAGQCAARSTIPGTHGVKYMFGFSKGKKFKVWCAVHVRVSLDGRYTLLLFCALCTLAVDSDVFHRG